MDVVPVGPRKVGAKSQVSVPAELLDEIGIAVGDGLWFMVNPDRPGTLVVLPRHAMAEIVQKGWTAI